MNIDLIRGRLVLVRAYGGEARVCRLLSLHGGLAYITDSDGLSRINAGEYAANATLFPMDDIFVYDQMVDNGDMPEWSRLTPLKAVLVAGGDNA